MVMVDIILTAADEIEAVIVIHHIIFLNFTYLIVIYRDPKVAVLHLISADEVYRPEKGKNARSTKVRLGNTAVGNNIIDNSTGSEETHNYTFFG